jgi:hypothetical protein
LLPADPQQTTQACVPQTEHAEGCWFAPSTGGAGAEPRLGFRSPSSRMMFSGRGLTKTVPVHFTHAGDQAANADDSCLSTGEWARSLLDGRG